MLSTITLTILVCGINYFVAFSPLQQFMRSFENWRFFVYMFFSSIAFFLLALASGLFSLYFFYFFLPHYSLLSFFLFHRNISLCPIYSTGSGRFSHPERQTNKHIYCFVSSKFSYRTKREIFD